MRKRPNREVVREKSLQPQGTAAAPSAVISGGPHQVEEEVRRELMGQSDLRFSSLVVRRIPGGVCLEGVLEVDESEQSAVGTPDVDNLARRVAGVEAVLNHLVVQRCTEGRRAPTPKG